MWGLWGGVLRSRVGVGVGVQLGQMCGQRPEIAGPGWEKEGQVLTQSQVLGKSGQAGPAAGPSDVHLGLWAQQGQLWLFQHWNSVAGFPSPKEGSRQFSLTRVHKSISVARNTSLGQIPGASDTSLISHSQVVPSS